MRQGDTGTDVSQLQRLLNTVGLKLTVDGWYGEATAAAVMAFQRRVGLVADGVTGPKTVTALNNGFVDPQHLRQKDLQAAAERLGVPLAAIMAVNAVESRGRGFLDDGRPVILFERHVLHRLLDEAVTGINALASRYPSVINPKRGGYAGGAAEWSRLAAARQATVGFGELLAEQSCSWGAFQIMGYHWQALGYASPSDFVAAMHKDEAAQLDAFVRFIEADPALHKALKGRKWADFARIYNGPAYKENLYDQKLARAFERFTTAPEEDAA
ncbi:MAG: DUF3380 domain-containing protein [Rhodocyclales bacterium]|nr:DUF3380 domain-containing protein [Rhodocyclales bacterium]